MKHVMGEGDQMGVNTNVHAPTLSFSHFLRCRRYNCETSSSSKSTDDGVKDDDGWSGDRSEMLATDTGNDDDDAADNDDDGDIDDDTAFVFVSCTGTGKISSL
jgi:hypothetical protein